VIFTLDNHKPLIHPNCFVADSADVVGRVTLEEDVSVWFQAVLRADNDDIFIGKGSNVQDGVVVHVDPGFPCRVGAGCVIGHRAVLHGCTLGDEVLVGIGATILNGATVPSRSLIGAGALVTEGKTLESGFLYVGVPARKARALGQSEIEAIRRNTQGYKARADLYLKSLYPINRGI
jgi:carbonic anhydrase/acetyltransferase-like protein (isoleucine patch superfamily)